MRKVQNGQTVTKIAMRSMMARKSRNLIAVLAIALTSVLFTSLFVIGGSLIQKQQESTMRQVGGSAHSGYKYLTREEYEKVAADPELKDVSYRILVGDAENKELKKLRTEISYYEDLDAKMNFCYPVEGTMPKEKYDIVASDLTLKALGIPCRIGQKVPLEFTVKGKKYKQEFHLSGWFYGDRVSASQVVSLSREYVEEVAPTPTGSYRDSLVTADDYAGRICVDFNFRSSWNLEGQLEKLNARLGFEDMAAGINWAYMASEIDPKLIIMIAVLLSVVLLSGYLIIYNIFYINVYGDIRFYGLLKTIGTTGKQLKRIVHRQAYVLSAVGIPLGLLAGYFTGQVMFPVVTSQLNMGDTFTTDVTVSPWIFAGSAVFSFLTVYISCVKPCRIAAKVSAVEAVRFTEGSRERRPGKKQKIKTRRTKKITMRSFAMANMKRNKKKAFIVILSLSISLILLNSIYSLVSGFDMDAFISSRVISDYLVADATVDNAGINESIRVTDGVTEEFLEELEQQTGITEIGNVYYKEIMPVYTEEEYQRFEDRIWSRMDELFVHEIQMFGEEIKESFAYQREARYVDGKAYGLDRLPFEKLEHVEGSLDWEKFSTGKYVITNRYGFDEELEHVDYYDVGEKVTLHNEAGESREYEVLAVASMPYAAELQSYGIFDCTYILPPEEFFWYCGERQPMKTLFNVEKESRDRVKAWISDYCENVNPDLTYTSRDTMAAEFDSLKNMFAVVGGLLSFILAMIGVLNFINTMITGILSRRQEFAMIEAVGMTGGQLQRMLVWEGGFYAVFTIAAAVAAGAVLNCTVIRSIGSMYFFFKWNFTILPILFCVPVILLVVLLVPVSAYRRMCRDSVVERIRVTE